jgi:hypothetical protein
MSPQWARGIFCHSTLAVTPDCPPLGLLAQRNWVRDAKIFAALPLARKRAVAGKNIKTVVNFRGLKETALR